MSLVSICIPSYKPEYFELCLASAIAQTYPNTEIIVSDQCPTEGIRQICDKFPGKVKYSRNPESGAQNNILRLIDLAQGHYIKYLLDDDILHPFCVQHLVEALETTADQNTKLSFSPRDLIDPNNKFLEHINLLEVKDTIQVFDGSRVIQGMVVLLSNFVGEMTTTLFRKEDCYDAQRRNVIFDFGGQRYHGLGDVSAWLHMASKGNVAVHPATLSYFRQHAQANSNPAMNPGFIYAITDWELAVRNAAAGGYLDRPSASQAYQNIIRSYRYWIGLFPQLGNELPRLERLAGGLAA